MNIALLVVALVLGSLRVVGIKSIAFQAAAHFFVGGLLGAAAAGSGPNRKVWLGLAGGLTILEVLCFFLLK